MSRTALCGALTLGISAAMGNRAAEAGPQGTVVVGGAADVQVNGTHTEITQHTNTAILTHDSFDIQQNESVNFSQPNAGSLAVNKIYGTDLPTNISGELTANGNVWVINPSGVAVSSTASVNVNGLIATSADISNEDIMAGKTTFSGAASGSAITNAGSITSGEGSVVLVAPIVENSGDITANGGDVALGAGSGFTVDYSGDGLTRFEVTPASGVSVTHSGDISAQGGAVYISAESSDAVQDAVVSIGGSIEATRIEEKGGVIVISGGANGITEVTGDVIADQIEGDGGEIAITGNVVSVRDTAKISADGAESGGKVEIGGGYQGAAIASPVVRQASAPETAPIPNAKITVVERGAQITANAGANGNGGEVIVWADQSTAYYGSIEAKGGFLSGDGGLAEVSGKINLAFDGSVDLSAMFGEAGDLLLDPDDVVFVAGIDGSGASDSELGDQTILAGDPGATFTVSVGALVNSVSAGNTSIAANNTITQSAGAAIDLSALANDLTLTTTNGDITLNDTFAGSSGTTTFDPGGTLVFGAGGSITGGGSIVITTENAVALGAITASALSVTTTSDNVTQSAALAITGNTSISAGSGSVTLTDVGNSFGTDIDISAAGIELVATGAVNLDAITSTGTLDVSSTNNTVNFASAVSVGAIDINGTDIDVDQDLSASTGNIALTATNDVTIAGDISATAGSVSITADAAVSNFDGDIVIDNGATRTVTSTAGAVVLNVSGGATSRLIDNGANSALTVVNGSGDFAIPETSLSANGVLDITATDVSIGSSVALTNLTMRNSGNDDIGIGTAGDAVATTFEVTDAELALVAGSVIKFLTGGNSDMTIDTISITEILELTNGFAGTGSAGDIIFSGANTVGALDIFQSNAISQTGSLVVTGATNIINSIATANGSGTGHVVLTNTSNNFGGTVQISVPGKDVTLVDTNAISLSTISSNTFDVTATDVDISTSLTTTGATTFRNGTAAAMDFGTTGAGWDLTDAEVGLIAAGSVVVVTENQDFNLVSVTNLTEALSVTAGTGNFSYEGASTGLGALTVVSAADFVGSGGSASLNVGANTLTANVTDDFSFDDLTAGSVDLTIGDDVLISGTNNITSAVTLDAGSRAIDFVATTVDADGTMQVQQFVGGTLTTPALNLNTTDGAVDVNVLLSTITDTNVNATGTGNVTVDSVSTTNNLNINAGTGTASFITAASSVGNVSITGTSVAFDADLTVTTNLTATATDGTITQTGFIDYGAVGTFSATNSTPADADITLFNAANNFGTVVNASGADIRLQDAVNITLGDIDATTLEVASPGGNILDDGDSALNGDINVTGNTTLTGLGNVIVNDAFNDFADDGSGASISASGPSVIIVDLDSIVLGTIDQNNAGGFLTVTVGNASNAGTITDAGAITSAGTSANFQARGAITLDNAGHSLAGTVSLDTDRLDDGSDAAITLLEDNATTTTLTLGFVEGTNVTITADGLSDIVGTSAAHTVTGNGFYRTDGGAITLTNSGNILSGVISADSNFDNAGGDDGAVAITSSAGIQLGAIDATTLTITAAGAITDEGVIDASGNAAFLTESAGAAPITIDGQDSAAGSLAHVFGGTITLDTDTSDDGGESNITFNDPQTTGTLTLAAVDGQDVVISTLGTRAIVDSAALEAQGSATFSAAGANITLDNANVFNGTVNVDADSDDTGAAGDVSIIGASTTDLDLTLGNIDAATLNVSTTNTLLQAGGTVINASDTATFTATAGDIDLNGSNQLASTVNLSGEDIRLNNAADLALGTVTTAGDNGDPTLAADGDLTVTGTSVAVNGALSVNDLSMTASTGGISQVASASIVATGQVDLVAATTIVLQDNGNDFGTVVNAGGTGGGDATSISLRDSGAITLGDIDTGDLLIETLASGNIFDDGVTAGVGSDVNATGSATLLANGAGAIVIDDANTDFVDSGTSASVSATGATVELFDTDGIVLGDISQNSPGGVLNVYADGAITDVGTINSDSTFGSDFATEAGTSGTITLDSTSSTFDGFVRLNTDRNLDGGLADITFIDNDAAGFDLAALRGNNVTVTAEGGGDINVSNPALVSGNVFFRTDGGSITATSATNDFQGQVHADTNFDDTGSDEDLVWIIDGTGGLQFGAIAASSLVATSTGGDIIDTSGSQISVTGASSLAATANDIILDNTTGEHDFDSDITGDALTFSAVNATIRDVDQLSIGASAATGSATLTAMDFDIDGTLTVGGGTGTVTFLSSRFLLSNSNAVATTAGGDALFIQFNNTDAGNVAGGTAIFREDATVATTEFMGIFGAAIPIAVYEFNSGATIGNIQLETNQAGADIAFGLDTQPAGTTSQFQGSLTALAADDIIHRNAHAISVSGVTSLSGDNIQLDATANDLGTLVNAIGTSIILADAGDITLGDIDAVTGAGTLSVQAGGAILDEVASGGAGADIDVNNGTTLTAGTSITLDNSGNNFNADGGDGAVSVSAGSGATLFDTTEIQLGAMDVTGNLTVTAEGTITDAASGVAGGGDISVTGTTSLLAQDGADVFDIQLDNSVVGDIHDFGGAISLTGEDIHIQDVDGIIIAGLTATDNSGTTPDTTINNGNNGDLTLIANGDVTDTGTILVPGGTSIAAGTGSITLDTGTNDLADVGGTELITATADGAISITGDVDSARYGTVTAGGAVNLTATTGLEATTTVSGSAVTVASAGAVTISGDVTATAGAISLSSDTDANGGDLTLTGGTTISTPGSITIEPNAGNVVDTGAGTVTIAANSGVMGADAFAFDNYIFDQTDLIVSTDGAVSQNAGTTIQMLTGQNISVTATTSTISLTEANDFTGRIDALGTNIAITDINALNLGAIDATGTLTVLTGGTVTDTAGSDISVTGDSTITAESGGAFFDVVLDNSTSGSDIHDFAGSVSITGEDVQINDINGLDFAGVTTNADGAADTGTGNIAGANGTLNVQSEGAVTQSGAITVPGDTTLTALSFAGATRYNVTLGNTGNSIAGIIDATAIDLSLYNTAPQDAAGEAGTTLGSVSLTGNLSITSTMGGIGDNAADTIQVAGSTSLIAQGGSNFDILLDNVGHDFSATSSFNATGEDITLVESNGIQLGSISANASANDDLIATNTGALSLTAAGTITDEAAISVAGDATISTTGGAANAIAIDGLDSLAATVTHAFGGTVVLDGSGGAADVSLVDDDAAGLTVGNVTGNNVTIYARGGGDVVATTGIQSVSGLGFYRSDDGAITLDNAANNFVGALSADGDYDAVFDPTLGTQADAVTIVDSVGGLILGDIDAGTLSVTSTGGGITDAGALVEHTGINVEGATTITASSGGADAIVELNDIVHDFGGEENPTDETAQVNVTGSDITLYDTDGLKLGAVAASGTLSVAAEGSITDSDTLGEGIIVNGNTTLTARDGADNYDILLDNLNGAGTGPGHDFNSVTLTGEDISINDANAISVSATAVDDAALAMALDATLEPTAGQGGSFNVDATTVVIDSLNAGGETTITGTGDLTFTDVSIVGGFNATTDGDIIIGQIESSTGGIDLTTTAGNVQILSVPLVTTPLNAAQDISLTATAGRIVDGGGTVGRLQEGLTFRSTGGNITFDFVEAFTVTASIGAASTPLSFFAAGTTTLDLKTGFFGVGPSDFLTAAALPGFDPFVLSTTPLNSAVMLNVTGDLTLVSTGDLLVRTPNTLNAVLGNEGAGMTVTGTTTLDGTFSAVSVFGTFRGIPGAPVAAPGGGFVGAGGFVGNAETVANGCIILQVSQCTPIGSLTPILEFDDGRLLNIKFVDPSEDEDDPFSNRGDEEEWE